METAAATAAMADNWATLRELVVDDEFDEIAAAAAAAAAAATAALPPVPLPVAMLLIWWFNKPLLLEPVRFGPDQFGPG